MSALMGIRLAVAWSRITALFVGDFLPPPRVKEDEEKFSLQNYIE
jgi:hypothetical protein